MTNKEQLVEMFKDARATYIDHTTVVTLLIDDILVYFTFNSEGKLEALTAEEDK